MQPESSGWNNINQLQQAQLQERQLTEKRSQEKLARAQREIQDMLAELNPSKPSEETASQIESVIHELGKIESEVSDEDIFNRNKESTILFNEDWPTQEDKKNERSTAA